MKDILFKHQDLDYKAFNQKLIPTVHPDTVIGVRTPVLRKLAKELTGTNEGKEFIKKLPHQYYEENNLHGFLIEQIRDFDLCIAEINRFLPYVDNWATCDTMRPRCFSKNADRLLSEIEKWLKSDHVYTVRFGIEMLMVHYLDGLFDEKYPKLVSAIKSEEYYINMMIAWYFATALAKQWDKVFPYITENRLSQWVHNKTIQKAVESYRITPGQKELLRKLKRGAAR